MKGKKIFAAFVLGMGLLVGTGMAPQAVQASSVWAATIRGQDCYVDTDSIYQRSDGFNVVVSHGRFTCPMMFRYQDNSWYAMYGGDVLTPVYQVPLYQAVFDLCQQYM